LEVGCINRTLGIWDWNDSDKVGFVVMVADVVAERKVVGDPAELVLDGGFAMPDSNAFGQTFR
jgi:inositol oxygenase